MINAAKLPLWRNAVENFLALNPEPGRMITRDWLEKEFGISYPVNGSRKEIETRSLQFLAAFDAFRKTLLTEHQIEIVNMRNGTYEVVHPRDQTRLALTKRTRNIAKEIKEMTLSIVNTDITKLNASERQEHADGLAKASRIRSMFSRKQIEG